ncbi:hypothetical protein BURMUCGD1_4221 [Burkholderia multivorans CGD1]|nr:hypothetical protein BURMUCGD1_4221 [Burkholderia multivorans CGD1]
MPVRPSPDPLHSLQRGSRSPRDVACRCTCRSLGATQLNCRSRVALAHR